MDGEVETASMSTTHIFIEYVRVCVFTGIYAWVNAHAYWRWHRTFTSSVSTLFHSG